MKVDELRRPPETVLEHIADGANVVVGVTNGEPVRILEPIGAMRGLFPRRLKERPHPGRSQSLRLLRNKRHAGGRRRVAGRHRVTARTLDGEITLGQQLQQARNLNRLAGAGWGLRLGRRFEVATHGPVGYAAVSAATLADSLSVIARFSHVRAPYFRLHVQRSGDRVALRVEERVRLPDAERIPLVETLMLSLQRLVEAIVGDALRRASFDFAWAAPSYAAEYRTHHPGPVRFDAPVTQLTIPADWLALTCPLADPVMYETSLRKLEALARRLDGDDHVVARVEALIEASGERAPSLAQVAKRVHLSPRTVIRRLRRVGTTYHDLLDAHRRAHAETLLKNPAFGVAEVSHRLGHGDPANFGRACRRWFGMAPGRYRRVYAPE